MMVDSRDDEAVLDLTAQSLDEQHKQLIAGDEPRPIALDNAHQVEWQPASRRLGSQREMLNQQFPIV